MPWKRLRWPWRLKSDSERRRDQRHAVALPATYRVTDAITRGPLTPRRPGRITNLSRGGCCLEVEELHLEGFDLRRCQESPKDYHLELAIAAQRGGVWTVATMVRWISPDRGDRFRLGLRFEEPVTLPGSWRRLFLAPVEAPAAAV